MRILKNHLFSTNKIGNKIILMVIGMAFLCQLSLVAFYTKYHELSMLEQNQQMQLDLADVVIQGLSVVMLSGSAEIAQSFADQINLVKDIQELRILRLDGNEAYRDNDTILDVNFHLGKMQFPLRKKEIVVPVLDAQNAFFLSMQKTMKAVSYVEAGSMSEDFLTVINPILTDKKCFRCHGKSKKIMGAVKLTISLKKVHEYILKARSNALWILLASVILLVMLTYLLINKIVSIPIAQITKTMKCAEQGDLTQTVPVLGNDELSTMATCFNSMVGKLLETHTGLQQEQNKLTTIILSAKEGIIVTDRDGNIVLVNPAAEHLLNKKTIQIVQDGFSNFLDSNLLIDSILDTRTPILTAYNDRFLSIYAEKIVSKAGTEIGSAALIRDVTEEKKLEGYLRELSYVDQLTKLLNRRRMEEVLIREFNYSKRHGTPLSFLMLDVDHFKHFNDEHGHDQGDRVLQHLGRILKMSFRNTDYPCRYGGEEFCIILPNTYVSGGKTAAENLCKSVANQPIDGLRVTISIGVSCYPECKTDTPDTLIKTADNALYVAKREGRNRVVIATG